MRAMVLAAGFGTRLGNLTKEWPKPMLDVNGLPMIEHIIRHLVRYNFLEIGVNLHFMPEVIRAYLVDGQRFGAQITYSFEPLLLGTAGGVKKMEYFFKVGGSFLIQYGDVVTDQDLMELIAFHKNRQAMVTMLVHKRVKSNSIVVLSDNGMVIDFLERPTEAQRQTVSSPWVNSGICLCEPEILEYIPQDIYCDLPRDIFPKIMKQEKLYAFPLSGYRCAVDSPERLAELRSALEQDRCRL